jgi:signal peptidase I
VHVRGDGEDREDAAPRRGRGSGRRLLHAAWWGLRGTGGTWRDLGGLGLVAVLFWALSFHVSVVRGNSMTPGIHDGDRILVEPWSHLFAGVARGDVVVLRSPVDPTVDYIKRVIGVPGDQVVIAAGRVWVNGELLDEPYAVPGEGDVFQWTRVAEDHYFVLGDNRPHSSDSREFGLVPARSLRGRVDLRVWPPPRAGRVH